MGKKKIIQLFVLVMSVSLVGASCSNDDIAVTDEMVRPASLFHEKFLICHRGQSGYPENTLVGIEAAISAGYKAIECDIEITKDGVCVLSHDKTIDRCSNGGAEYRT